MAEAITEKEFNELKNNMSKPVVLEFGADW